MGWGQVALLWLLAAALAAQYVFVDRRRPVVHPAERPARHRLLGDLRVGTVVGVRLERGGFAVALRRHDGEWAVEQPPGGVVAAGLIEAFVEALTTVEEIQRIPADGVADAALGFGAGALRLAVSDVAGRELLLTVGGGNAAGTAVYARVGATGHAVLIGRNLEYYATLILQEVRRATEPGGNGPVAWAPPAHRRRLLALRLGSPKRFLVLDHDSRAGVPAMVARLSRGPRGQEQHGFRVQ